MEKKIILLILTLYYLLPLYADSFEEIYAEISDYIGIDDNSGQYAFLVLRIPPGGKQESMGTAYTAISEGTDFFESNPAGSSFLEETEISFYHNNWIDDASLESVYYGNHNNHFGYGIGGKMLHVPFDRIDEYGDLYQNDDGSYASAYYTETIGSLNISYNFFPDFYYQGFSVGANVKGGYRHVPDSIAENQSGFALMADVGIITRFNLLKSYMSRKRNLSIGLNIKNVGFELIEEPDPLPTEIRVGVAWLPLRPITISFDFFQPVTITDFSTSESFGGAAGIDVVITDFVTIQAGALYKPGLARVTMGSDVTFDDMSFNVNYSLDLTNDFRNVFQRVSVVASFKLGDYDRKANYNTARELYIKGIEKYAEGNLEEAIRFWKNSLEVFPEFTPSIEMMSTADDMLTLQKEIEENQVIEDFN